MPSTASAAPAPTPPAVNALLVLVVAVACPVAASAQSRPFLFNVVTSPEDAGRAWTAYYDAGYSERTGDPFGLDGVEQRLGVQGSLGDGFTLLGRLGLGLESGGDTLSSQEAEVLKDLLPASSSLRLAVGGGARREWQGDTVALARVCVGRSTTRSLLFGNLRLEKPFATGRDPIDLITTLGWLVRVGGSLQVGVEAIGEDVEGLWAAEEAEGGAKFYVGPTIHWARPDGRVWAALGGGPVAYASRREVTSPAPRPLGADGNGFTVRVALGVTF
jgi:hypothetical protein